MGVWQVTVPAAEGLRELAGRLRDLAGMPVHDRHALDAWYVAARRLEDWIRADPALCDALPHFVWHYLADADIRKKNSVYGAEQRQQLMGIVEWLQRGELPKNE